MNDELRKKQIDKGIPEGKVMKVILDVKTRWNSTFFLLDRFLELSTILNEILLEKPFAPPMPTAIEIKKLKLLLQLLKPLEHVTREASAENYITISKIIPMVNCLIKQIDKFQNDSSFEDVENVK